MSAITTNIESLQQEERVFHPPKSFADRAHIKSMAELEALRTEASTDPEEFWARFAESELHWFKKWDAVLRWEAPHAEWFVGGKINISDNCLDRHLQTWRRNKAALIWEGEPGDTRTLTYEQLHSEVCRFANVLKKIGVGKGDRVALYMPLIPELAISMLACARIGATHSVVFGGFSSTALVDRINDAQCKAVITADGGWRRGNEVKLKAAVDEALKETPSVKSCVVVRRTGSKIHLESGRDHWWHELMEAVEMNCPAEELDSEHPLFILYTSGTTGKPKGILHTTGGYLLQAHLTTKWIFDIKDEDIYWCTADIGWERCPIVDTWWQTETGGIMITPLPGATPTKPGSATKPFPGIEADVMTRDGKSVGPSEGGYLVINRPWPGMLRTIYGDDERYRQQYWSQIDGVYFAGDGARKDQDGYFWIMGRIDDVINVAGHRLGTAEIESALVSHEAVAEAAVVAKPDDLKGSAIVAFVTLEGGREPSDPLKEELRQHVAKEIGALARPDDIRFADALPKTRSGKIMRRLLREIATSGSVVGDVTTLEDFSVLEKLRSEEE